METRGMGTRPRVRPCVVATLLFGLAGCRGPGAVPTFPGSPVVLISIDTLRADRLPAYGYAGVATPHLDRFRKDAILYRNAYSPCPMTLPSHVTMLTGLLPPEHGVRSNLGFVFEGARHASLPRLLSSKGYATGAAVSSYVLRGETGLGPIFDAYEDSLDPGPGGALADQQRPGAVTAGLAGRWIEGHAGAAFFYFFHVYEPHVPYEPPEPFRSRYRDLYDGEVAAADAVVGGLLDHLGASAPTSAPSSSSPRTTGRGSGTTERISTRSSSIWRRSWCRSCSSCRARGSRAGRWTPSAKPPRRGGAPRRGGGRHPKPLSVLDSAPGRGTDAARRQPRSPGRPRGSRGPRPGPRPGACPRPRGPARGRPGPAGPPGRGGGGLPAGEISALPGNLTAWANLAALLFARGRRDEVDPLFEEMAGANPSARSRQVAAAAWGAFGDQARAAGWRALESAARRAP